MVTLDMLLKYELYKPKELAQLLRVSVLTVIRHLRTGKIKGIRINERGDWRIHKEEVERLLK